MTIPAELRNLVFLSVKLFGQAIQDIYGQHLFQQIEALRLRMKKVRNAKPGKVFKALEHEYEQLSKANGEDLHRIAKAFSLMLEIINACEAAYRTHRLKGTAFDFHHHPDSLIYVFTSHPTEARSREFLFLTDQVEDLLIRALEGSFEDVELQLLHLFRMALRIPLANNKRPQVKDEAHQILHTILDDRILLEQIQLKQKGLNVYFRTWVGGDKDGHPKVGPATMLETLTLSRRKLLEFVIKKLNLFHEELRLLNLDNGKLVKELTSLKVKARKLRVLTSMDGKEVSALNQQFLKLFQLAQKFKMNPPALEEIGVLFRLYPALVLPLEIREDAQLIHEALRTKQTIGEMLETLKKISRGTDPRYYVRGFIISMCQSSEDLLAAIKLIEKKMGNYHIPAVPLFENEQGLRHGVEILKSTFASYPMVKKHQQQWKSRCEVMLGYSDSSKENGVLPSRLLVEKALTDLERFLKKQKLTPVFFHGSGGSTGRGGGSLKEQIAWWPHSALNVYKMTIQGETIQRHFHHAPILRSQVNKVVQEFSKHKDTKFVRPAIADQFSSYIQDSYRELVKDTNFQQMTTEATPYDFLNLLKIGSRPTKRSGKGQFSLRAIPWILCWTQTRLLLPIWWGVGSAWARLNDSEKKALKAYHKSSPLMQSYVKNLGFTLARIEMGVWEFHLIHSRLPQDTISFWQKRIREEYDQTMMFFEAISGTNSLTWFQPRLGESIIFRSSMIHPLNVIQKISLERRDHVLLRESVTGIACGMLMTG